MFEDAFRVSEYRRRRRIRDRRHERHSEASAGYDLLAFGFRVSCNGKTVAYSGDSGPSDELTELARDADLFLCEATLEPNPEGRGRSHLAADEAKEAFEAAARARLLLTHRPKERPLPRSSSRSTTARRSTSSGTPSRWGQTP